jgi:hypothetical protein
MRSQMRCERTVADFSFPCMDNARNGRCVPAYHTGNLFVPAFHTGVYIMCVCVIYIYV